LRFSHHGKGGVLVNLEGFERVGNKQQFHGVYLKEVREYDTKVGPMGCRSDADA
jgi:hypothetical protein